MSATATTEMTVVIDDAIRAKPDVLESVQEAQNYFEENYSPPEGAFLKAAPGVMWEWKPNGSDFPIRCTFQEEADLGSVEVIDRYKPAQLRDVQTRNFLVLGSLRHILKERMDRRSVIIKRLLNQLDLEEANGSTDNG